MSKYEILVLSIPEITPTESSNIETALSKLVTKAQGKMISWEKWGKYLLAYPVKGNEYGVYFLTRFEVPEENKLNALKEIKSMFDIKFNDITMRYLISHLDPQKSLEYKKPAPLDETPKNVDEFLKENKMEGLMKEKAEASSKNRSSEEVQNG